MWVFPGKMHNKIYITSDSGMLLLHVAVGQNNWLSFETTSFEIPVKSHHCQQPIIGNSFDSVASNSDLSEIHSPWTTVAKNYFEKLSDMRSELHSFLFGRFILVPIHYNLLVGPRNVLARISCILRKIKRIFFARIFWIWWLIKLDIRIELF